MINHFFQVKNETFSDAQINNDLNKISKWAFEQKILFNHDPSKQAMEMFFP